MNGILNFVLEICDFERKAKSNPLRIGNLRHFEGVTFFAIPCNVKEVYYE